MKFLSLFQRRHVPNHTNEADAEERQQERAELDRAKQLADDIERRLQALDVDRFLYRNPHGHTRESE